MYFTSLYTRNPHCWSLIVLPMEACHFRTIDKPQHYYQSSPMQVHAEIHVTTHLIFFVHNLFSCPAANKILAKPTHYHIHSPPHIDCLALSHSPDICIVINLTELGILWIWHIILATKETLHAICLGGVRIYIGMRLLTTMEEAIFPCSKIT